MNSKFKILIIVAICVLIVVNFAFLDGSYQSGEESKTDVAQSGEVKSSGKALIGGDFSLTDQDGKEFTSEDLKGKKSLIYFGFTNCPMICPTALNNMSLALDQLGDKASEFKPVFITTDPERDTQERLKEFLSSFHPDFVGLTGSKEKLDEAYEGYKVYAKKVDTGTENYDMNHTSIIYVMNEEGEFVTHFSHQTAPEEISKKLKTL